jgi:hypothetical protein
MTSMNKDQAASFIQALNLAQHYLPPLIFAQLVSNPISKTLAAVANGMVELQAKPAAASNVAEHGSGN